MDGPRLALLDASTGSGGGTRRNFRRELDANLVEFDASAGDLPDGFGFDGFVVTGSSASVYWDEPWIDALAEWVEGATNRGLPALGVCYGHQVLATALGGSVEHMGDYEIGYREINRIADDPLFEGVDETFTVFTTHQDAVVDLPPGATLLAENDYGVQGFRKGSAWGVQFHPEYDLDYAEWLAERKRDHEMLTDAEIDDVVAGITPENYAAACEVKQLFDNFTRYVRATADRAAD
jgi:GMP synthase (glutamine-hydrolysing)